MALTKIPAYLSSTPSIVDGGNATALTIDSSENITLTGTLSDSSGLYATQAYVTTQINGLIDSAPGALNTLNELAAAMGDDAAFSTTVTNSIALKAPIAGPTFTGTVTSGGDINISTASYGYKISGTSVLGYVGGNVIVGDLGAGVILEYNGSERLATTNTGINITGSLTADSGNFGDGDISNVGTIEVDTIAGDADTNTNISFPGSDTITFTEGGAEAMRITSDGRVGIGTNGPSYTLDTKATAAADNRTIARFEGVGNSGSQAAGGQYVSIMRSGAISNSADNIAGGLLLGIASAVTSANCGIRGTYEYNSGRDLELFTSSDNTSAPVTRMVIKGDGKVGIGTTSPNTKLYVYEGSAAAHIRMKSAITQGDGTVFGKLTMQGDSGEQAGIYGIYDHASSAYSGMSFYTDGSAGTVERMRIDSDGKVGIGTNGPTAPLQVAAAPSDTVGTVGFSLKDSGNAIEFGLRLDATYKDLHIDRYYSGSWYNTMSFDRSSGKVGIGETAPLGKLHIKEDDSGASSVNSNFDQLVLEDDSHSGMTILSGTSSDGGIYFGDSGANNKGQFKYRHSDDSFRFITNDGADALVLEADDDAIFGGKVTTTGQILAPAGSASAPSYAFTAQASTGMYKPGTSQLYFSVAGTRKIRLESAQMVVETALVANSTLNVSNKITGIAATNRPAIELTGGTGSQSYTKIHMLGAGTAVDAIRIQNDGGHTILGTERNSGGGLGGSSLGYSSIYGSIGATAAHIMTNNSVKMTIESGGNVGIGITDPDQKLDVQGYIVGGSHRTDNAEKHMKYMGVPYHSSDTSNIAGLYLNGNSSGNHLRYGGGVDATSAATTHTFYTAALTTGAYEGTRRFYIHSDGNVAVGNTGSPSDLLDIYRTSTDQTKGLTITNAQPGGYGSGIIFRSNRSDGGGDLKAAAEINVRGENSWNSDSTTSSAMDIYTMEDNTLTQAVTITSDGDLLIGGTTDQQNTPMVSISNYTATFTITNNSSGGNGAEYQVFRRNNTQIGSINMSGTTGVTYNTSSDYRLKENIVDMGSATAKLKQLQPRTFNFISEPDKTLDGFVAHEVSSIVPEAIQGTKDETEEISNVILNANGSVNETNISETEWTAGKLETTDVNGNTIAAKYAGDTTWVATKTIPKYQGIDTGKLVPLLVKALQEAMERIEAAEARIATLEG